jgi:hypothetical protein
MKRKMAEWPPNNTRDLPVAVLVYELANSRDREVAGIR